MNAMIVLLPGDGIGPEVAAEAEKVLRQVAQRFGHHFSFQTHEIGGLRDRLLRRSAPPDDDRGL